MAKAKKARTPRSPYQKYGKTPFAYSSYYREWKRATLEHGSCSKQAQLWDAEFVTHFGIVRVNFQ